MYANSMTRILPPIAEALGLEEIKEYLKITTNHEDKLLKHLIEAVTVKCEAYTSKALIEQTWKVSFKQIGCLSLVLPIKPAREILQIDLINHNGLKRLFNPKHYRLEKEENEVHFSSLPFCYLMRIEYLAGFGTCSSSLPTDLKMTMISHLAFMYQNREAAHDFPMHRYDEFKNKRL